MLHRVGGHSTHSSTSVVRRIPVTTERSPNEGATLQLLAGTDGKFTCLLRVLLQSSTPEAIAPHREVPSILAKY